ncbi:MAG: shikimate kinase [Armatimonadota bacterium]
MANLPKSNIYIAGFMGTGKSTLGKELAKMLGRKFIDMDREIEKEEKLSLAQIFSDFGEEYFKKKELELAHKLSDMKNRVVATGGTTILNEDIKNLFLKSGLIICIKADEKSLEERLRKLHQRPQLHGDDSLISRIREFLANKGEIYKKVSIQLDTTDLTPKQGAEKIVNLLKTRQKILQRLNYQYLEL